MRKVKLLFPLMVASLLSSCMLLPSKKDTGSGSGSGSGSNSNSQSDSGSSTGSWSSDIQKEMKQYIGFVLPYVPLDETTLYHGYVDTYESEGVGIYCIGDDNKTNLVKDYGAALKAAGLKEETDEDGDTYYVKTVNGADFYVDFGYYEATSDYEAGNEISVQFAVE